MNLLCSLFYDIQVYEGEVSRMQGENKSLKDHLQRSLRELKAYQMRYPSPFSSQEVKEDEPHWSASPEIMTPLFDAYDTRKAPVYALCRFRKHPSSR
jgi:hypothetical protein